jgi:hypothetical protein
MDTHKLPRRFAVFGVGHPEFALFAVEQQENADLHAEPRAE